MRWDSPIVLVIAGSVAIHTLLVVFFDIMVVTHPIVIEEPPPVIEMVDVDVEEPPEPPKPEPPPPEEEKEDEKPPVAVATPVQPQAQVRTAPRVQTLPAQPPTETPPTPGPGGGDEPPVYKLPDAPSGKGIAVPDARGTSGRGQGGSGGGTGGGSGSGAGTPAPPPVSIATIKNPAMPKGDYGYFDAGRDYPAEARQLGIEGKLRVKLVVDATGKVRSAVLIDSLGHGLDELALARAKLIEFEPAKDTTDKPVTSVVVWTFNMALPK